MDYENVLLKAANAGAGEDVAVQIKSTSGKNEINAAPIFRRLATIYARAAKYFVNVTDETLEDAYKLAINDISVISVAGTKGKMNSGDLVLLSEALKWTAQYFMTEKKPMIRFVMALADGEMGFHPEQASKGRGSLFNAFVIDGNDDITKPFELITPLNELDIDPVYLADVSDNTWDVVLK